MAASTLSSGGFSYAQAARGQTASGAPHTASSKATSGAVSPSNGVVSDSGSKANWADDVESSIPAKPEDSPKQHLDSQQDVIPTSQPIAPTSKVEEKPVNGLSGVSSPDLIATPSTVPRDEDILSAANGSSSDSAWESRSQASEPAWIAERKERQNRSESREQSTKREPKAQANSPQPQSWVLQEATPPPVNPWLKRAEEAKAKTGPAHKPAATPSAVTTAASPVVALKENIPPRSDLRQKAMADMPTEERATVASSKKPIDVAGAQHDRTATMDPPPKPAASTTTSNKPSNDQSSTSARNGTAGRQSLPNPASTPSIVSDESSWPTPDTSLEKERKDGSDKELEEKREEDSASASKNKKREWKILPVTPSFLFQTQGMNEPKARPPRGSLNGERGGKTGSSGRGRGGHRGASNGAGADRNSSRVSQSPAKPDFDPSAEPHSRAFDSDKQSIAKPPRASSANALGRRQPEHTLNGERPLAASGQPKTNGLQDTEKIDTTQPSESRQPRQARSQPLHTNISDHPDSMDDDLPKPIPKQALETADGTSRQIANVNARSNPDGRRDSRPADAAREAGWPASRPSKRGGRGRGGAGVREPTNGHQNNVPYQGNYIADFGAAYGVQPAPYQLPRGHHPFTYPANGRGGWNSRGGIRSQSIPIDGNYYPRMAYMPNGAPHHLAPINPYIANMYEPSNVPMTAFPYPVNSDLPHLIDMAITQLEYYFSVDNLLKDMFLRRQMDSKGFVLMDVVANFNRVKLLTEDKDLLRAACLHSEIIEICVGEDGKERLRRADGWQGFVLPMDQRDKSAQNDGQEQLRQLDRSQLPVSPSRGFQPVSIPLAQHSRYDRRSYDSAYSMVNGVGTQYAPYSGIPEVLYGEAMNGEEMRGRSARSPTHEIPFSPISPSMDATIDESVSEPDAFLDSQVDVLTLVVKMSPQSLPSYHSLSSRTFSNGSIDSRTILGESEKGTDDTIPLKKDGAPNVVNGTSDMHLPPVPRRASPNKPRSSDRSQKDSAPEVFWVKDQEGPISNLPAGLSSEPYVQLRIKALDQRNHAATGNCPYDMDVLYQFWCHFLIRNFNHRMYTEFKTYAHEDVKRTSYNGIQNLVKFYAQSLSSHSPIRDLVVRDYVDLVRNEPIALQSTAFKQLRSAWRNGALNLKNRKKLADIVDDKMKEQLDRLDT